MNTINDLLPYATDWRVWTALLALISTVVLARRLGRSSASGTNTEAPAVVPETPIGDGPGIEPLGLEPEPTPAPVEAAVEAVVEEEAPAAVEAPSDDAELRRGLTQTRGALMGKLQALFTGRSQVDEELLEELEEALLGADVGVRLAMRLVDGVREQARKGSLTSADDVRDALHAQVLETLRTAQTDAPSLADVVAEGASPRVLLFVGVNGAGKTTSIGKIAHQLVGMDKKVLLVAGDTYRAAAADQLGIWAERVGAEFVRGEEGIDPASVVFNGVQHAVQSGADVVLADTAGRLHTRTELMDEIRKVKKAAAKARAEAPDEVWLVVDATTGQNAVEQAKQFHEALGLTGIVLTKLDGTAKGGVVVAIADALGIPVRFVGIGEAASDLRPFAADAFASAMLAVDDR